MMFPVVSLMWSVLFILALLMSVICICLMANEEKAMAAHSSILAWRIPGTEEPGGLLSMGLHRVGHDGNDLTAAAAAAWQYQF